MEQTIIEATTMEIQLKEVFEQHCTRQVLFVLGASFRKQKLYGRLQELMKNAGVGCTEFSDFQPNPKYESVVAGIEALRAHHCDFIIAAGGGSAMDVAKCIKLFSEMDLSKNCLEQEIVENALPLLAIPTTAGTGSEATQFTVITDVEKDIKMLLKGGYLVPKIAIVDPAYTYSAPKSITAATGMDALTHAIEAYTSRKALPVTDTLAVSAVKRIMKYLPAAYKDGSDEKARYEMSVASYEAGICINNSTVTLVHGMSRPIGALFHVAHGISNAMLLTKCLAFALDGAYEKFANLGRKIGAATAEDDDKTASGKFIEALNEICKICEIPTLLEYGIPKDEFFAHMEKMAHDALTSGSPGNTMKPISEQDIIEIYKKLWE